MRDDERRLSKRRADPSEHVSEDPTASFAYELATQAPTKDVASVKAASDVYEANAEDADLERVGLRLPPGRHEKE